MILISQAVYHEQFIIWDANLNQYFHKKVMKATH